MYKRPATTYNLRRTFFARTSYSEFAIFLSAFLSPSQYLMCHARPAARKNKYSPRQPQSKKEYWLTSPGSQIRRGWRPSQILLLQADGGGRRAAAAAKKRNPRDGLKDLADRGLEASGGLPVGLGLILELLPAWELIPWGLARRPECSGLRDLDLIQKNKY